MATEIESDKIKELERKNKIMEMNLFLIHHNIQIKELIDLNLIIKHETGFSIQSKSKETELFISEDIFFSNKFDVFEDFLKSFSDEKYGKTLHEFYDSGREWVGSHGGLNNQDVSYLRMIPDIFENMKTGEEYWVVLENKLNEINNEMKTEILLDSFVNQNIEYFENVMKNDSLHFYKMLNYAKDESKSSDNLTELELAKIEQIQLFLNTTSVPSNLVSKDTFIKIDEMTEKLNKFHKSISNQIMAITAEGAKKLVDGLKEIHKTVGTKIDEVSQLLCQQKALEESAELALKMAEEEKKYEKFLQGGKLG